MLFFLLAGHLYAADIVFKERVLPKRFNECQLCHINKKSLFVSDKIKTKIEHGEMTANHGKKQLACSSCHDKGNHNFLVLPANFKDSSPVCKQCHMETYRDFLNGAHGKKTGGWMNNSRKQYHCIDCHNPHDVKFKKMETKIPSPQIKR